MNVNYRTCVVLHHNMRISEKEEHINAYHGVDVPSLINTVFC